MVRDLASFNGQRGVGRDAQSDCSAGNACLTGKKKCLGPEAACLLRLLICKIAFKKRFRIACLHREIRFGAWN